MQGTLGGLVVLVLAVVGKYVFNRLWQRSLLDDSSEAIARAKTLGLALQPLGYGPQIQMRGRVDDAAVSILWTGGLFGVATLVRCAGERTRHPALRTAAQIDAVLFGEE